MRLQQAIKLYAMSPASEGHSTLPAHDHPEQLLGRDKQRRGGKDKGGVSAGGPGSGRHAVGDRVVRNPKVKGWKDTPQMRDHNHGEVISVVKDGVRMRSDAQAKTLKDSNADKWDKASAEKGTFYMHQELVPEKNIKAEMIQTKGKGATRFHKHKVVDRAGRVVNSFKTRKEAKRASDGNPYTTVVSNSAPTTSQPRDNKTSGQVRDMLRDNPSDNRIDEQNKIKRG